MRTRELRTTEELCAIYRFSSREAVRKFIVRHQVPHTYRGRIMLVDLRDFDAEMERTRQAKARGMRVVA